MSESLSSCTSPQDVHRTTVFWSQKRTYIHGVLQYSEDREDNLKPNVIGRYPSARAAGMAAVVHCVEDFLEFSKKPLPAKEAFALDDLLRRAGEIDWTSQRERDSLIEDVKDFVRESGHENKDWIEDVTEEELAPIKDEDDVAETLRDAHARVLNRARPGLDALHAIAAAASSSSSGSTTTPVGRFLRGDGDRAVLTRVHGMLLGDGFVLGAPPCLRPNTDSDSDEARVRWLSLVATMRPSVVADQIMNMKFGCAKALRRLARTLASHEEPPRLREWALDTLAYASEYVDVHLPREHGLARVLVRRVADASETAETKAMALMVMENLSQAEDSHALLVEAPDLVDVVARAAEEGATVEVKVRATKVIAALLKKSAQSRMELWGKPGLVDWLMRAVAEGATNEAKAYAVLALGRFCLVPELTAPAFARPGLVDVFFRCADAGESVSIRNWGLGGLQYLARDREVGVALFETPNVVNVVVRLCSDPDESGDVRAAALDVLGTFAQARGLRPRLVAVDGVIPALARGLSHASDLNSSSAATCVWRLTRDADTARSLCDEPALVDALRGRSRALGWSPDARQARARAQRWP